MEEPIRKPEGEFDRLLREARESHPPFLSKGNIDPSRDNIFAQLEKHLADAQEKLGPASPEVEAMRQKINQARYTK